MQIEKTSLKFCWFSLPHVKESLEYLIIASFNTFSPIHRKCCLPDSTAFYSLCNLQLWFNYKTFAGMLPSVFLVCYGGAIDFLLYYGTGIWFSKFLYSSFPYLTFAINIAGCFLTGLYITVLELCSWFTF